MSSDFNVGDEVVCVDDGPPSPGCTYGTEMRPVKGSHYTIRNVEVEGVRVEEILNQLALYRCLDGIVRLCETVYRTNRFRKVDPKKIEIFREMCQSKPKEVAK